MPIYQLEQPETVSAARCVAFGGQAIDATIVERPGLRTLEVRAFAAHWHGSRLVRICALLNRSGFPHPY